MTLQGMPGGVGRCGPPTILPASPLPAARALALALSRLIFSLLENHFLCVICPEKSELGEKARQQADLPSLEELLGILTFSQSWPHCRAMCNFLWSFGKDSLPRIGFPWEEHLAALLARREHPS